MTEKKKEQTLKVQYEIEEYLYSHHFNIERNEMISTKISNNDTELKEPEFLYKFYNKSNYSINSLLENYLYFSNPRNFNDPFDCITNREKYILKGSLGIIQHRENIGVCCFSTINDNPLMWGHYANSYTGFCLKFDNRSLLKNNHIQIKSHISYLKNYQPSNENFKKVKKEIKELEIEEKSKENILAILAILNSYRWKYYDWKYEKEFRAIALNSNEFERKLKFEKENLLAIYIGHRMKSSDSNYYNLLLYILKNEYPNIKVYEVKPHPLIVKLEFEEIKHQYLQEI
nr:DUF2971 domain-containing protein [uncultured Flavobacterium sp.]